MVQEEFQPGDAVPNAGPYVALNVLGAPIDTVVTMRQGETFPLLPRGFTWKPLSSCSAIELRERAQYYRQMAGTASTEQVVGDLLKLAQRFDDLAEQREAQGGLC